MIGQRTRDEFKKSAVPELWLWLRLALFLTCGGCSFFLGWAFDISALNQVGGMFVFWGVAGIAMTPIASMCKAVAAAIERLR